ncbi:hypothetical protein P775_07565 [Puniceibacterium antarcticum]|uniref:Sensory/regulatory protein RpfC n=1 Tax=Puniceibacterium antarcticum TaxID=1206336 RepID=A0A2G8RH26_9RHOB|nr:PAS domain-containing hybrid sensor histidine kinase/response regulator [Puniceibacterium antarcticum]PIL20822.1 hypothetical protein P775_07565 [Puniceibacterium antarcticum]
MARSSLGSDAQAIAFEARHSPIGLLLRYARGRVRHFWRRQALTLMGSGSLVFLETAQTGAIALVLALLGEAVDCAILRQVPRWHEQGRSFGWLRALTTVSAGFQALTIAACILLTLTFHTGNYISFFAFAFLVGAVSNAGFVLTYHPLAGKTRLGIYTATGMIYMVVDVVLEGGLESYHAYEMMAVLMMAYIVRIFLKLVIASQRNQVQFSRDLIEGAQALEQSNRDLFDSQREARQLALVARHANDGVIMSDKLGGILWVNEAFVQMTGFALTEAVGRNVGDLLNGPETDAETVRAIRTALGAGRPFRTNILNYTKDGRQIWVDSNLVPICNEQGQTDMVVAIERDISAAKTHELTLTQATARAEEAVRAKAAFLATMSHEIRTPMNGIIGMSDLLSESALGPEQREYVSAINTSAEALLRIIDDILDYSKLDAGKMRMAEEPFNLARCVRLSVDLLRSSARDKGLFLDICHDVALPEVIVGDEGRVRQVLLNLLGNAIKFSDTGGVTLRTWAERTGTSYAVRISVTDTGVGVSSDQAMRIFDQFEQADVATTRKFGGTGLGLAISRQLARRMGGDLVIVPNDKPGASFAFSFVAGGGGADRRARPAPSTMPGLAELSKLKILLAEDNRTNSLLITRYLAEVEVQLLFATNGIEAVELSREYAPDVVLMDVSMPQLDGISATVQIRSGSGPQPYIIALTANAFDSDRVACFAAGMNDFLTKPLRKSDLLAALARCPKVHKPLGSPPTDRVTGKGQANEAPNWTSQPASGTTSGRSIRSSDR